MHITVYLGASCGTDPHLAQAVRELGHGSVPQATLVYGGSKTGLMGLLAQSALEQGGSVIGVEPECFMAQVLQYDGLTQLIVTRSMAERKAKMIHLGTPSSPSPAAPAHWRRSRRSCRRYRWANCPPPASSTIWTATTAT